MLPSALDVCILLVWWVVVYAYFVFPKAYFVTNIPVYHLRWDILYLVEGVMLIAISASAFITSSGPWRTLYRDICRASILYTVASEVMHSGDHAWRLPERRNR